MPYPEAFDPVWHIRESAYHPDHVRYYESVFTLGNGYLGTRGSLEEPLHDGSPATLIAGLFDKAPEQVTELANVANWLGVEIWIDQQPVTVQSARILSHERILDLKSGILHRKSLLQIGRTQQVAIVSERFVSIADVHLMGVRYKFTVVDTARKNCTLLLRTGFDGNVSNEGVEHFKVIDSGALMDNSCFMHQSALHSSHQVVLGGRTWLFKKGEAFSIHQAVKKDSNRVWLELNSIIDTDIQYTLEKTVSIYTSRETGDPSAAVKAKLHGCMKTPFENHIEEHKSSWAHRWTKSDIEIRGDDFAQIALRFSIFHLLQAASETDDRISIAAKALTGFGYKGHVFWDTETFILPYLNITNPLLSRNMLTYRYHTLEEARKRAREKGYRGAMFAWESADSGEETTPLWVKDPKQKAPIKIWSGVSEHHVVCDVAHAVWQYFLATGDTDFMLHYGAEILFDTARFWSSRVSYNKKNKRYEIRTIIGPDEYHENVDNNFFTNVMAQWNIRKGIEIFFDLKDHHPADWQRITKGLDLREKEIAEWRKVAEQMFIQVEERQKIFIQFDGFMDLQDIDLTRYADRTQPMDVVIGREATSNSKINKQPDVLMVFALLREEFPTEVKKRNWNFYEPLCGHGSSLSPAIHSLVASDIGLPEKAYEYFVRGARIDLNDKMGNTGHGVHAATAGGLLQAALYGFAGLRITGEGILMDPRLPEHWLSMRFNVYYKGKRIGIVINR